MLTIEEVQRRLQPMNLRHVARESGVEYGTLYRISRGGDNTSYRVVKLLSDWITGIDEGESL